MNELWRFEAILRRYPRGPLRKFNLIMEFGRVLRGRSPDDPGRASAMSCDEIEALLREELRRAEP